MLQNSHTCYNLWNVLWRNESAQTWRLKYWHRYHLLTTLFSAMGHSLRHEVFILFAQSTLPSSSPGSHQQLVTMFTCISAQMYQSEVVKNSRMPLQ